MSRDEELDLQLLRSARPWEQGCLRPASHSGEGGATSRRARPSKPSHFDTCPAYLVPSTMGKGSHMTAMSPWSFSEEFGCGLHSLAAQSRGKVHQSHLLRTEAGWAAYPSPRAVRGHSRIWTCSGKQQAHGIFLSPPGQCRINRANCGEATKPRISAVRRWIYLWRQLLGGWGQEIPAPPNEDWEGNDHFRIFFLILKRKVVEITQCPSTNE